MILPILKTPNGPILKSAHHVGKCTLAIIPLILISCSAIKENKGETSPVSVKDTVSSLETEKELYLPQKVWMVPENNDYNDENSTYSFDRSAESKEIEVFWAKEYGKDPFKNNDSLKRFDVERLLSEGERFYDYYVNKLKFVIKGQSVTDRYKILMYVFSGKDNTAFGGGEDEKIGVFWTPATRINKAPYGALAHELGHSFQYLVHADGAWGFSSNPEGGKGQPIWEMTSQWMLWQVYPDWITFENYHLKGFLKQTNLVFLHEKNQYHSPFVLEYWSNKHGVEFIGELWRQAKKGEDPVMAYKRMTGIDQKTFNDEIFDADRRFITWDIDRIRDVSAKYTNLDTTKLKAIGNNWYQITKDKAPQNYGYNAIKLAVPTTGSIVTINFKGIAGEPGFRAIQVEKAGWRYGFLAVKADGDRVYGKIHSDSEGTASFKVPENTEYLWFVVSGAPKEHWEHLSDGKEENDEQWPYKIKLEGTILDESVFPYKKDYADFP